MTKRTFNTDGRNNNKKPKLDNEIEALWGDDELDESVFDDFIKFDSQVEQNPTKNESILPDYDDFKMPKKMFCSTQLTATTSKPSSNAEKTSITVQRLRLQYEEKEGEIAVLRSQIRDIKAQSVTEFQKSQIEWKNKLSVTEKQMQSVRSELEFKNLEITNLKQKIISLNKYSMNLSSINDAAKSLKPITSEEKPIVHQNYVNNKLFITVPIDYPLKGVVDESMFEVLRPEKFVIENKLLHSFKNTIPYLQNKTVLTRIMWDKSRADISRIWPIMLKYCELNTDEIDSIKNIDYVNKMLCIALQTLEDLLGLLKEIKENLRTEDILQEDYFYLKRIKYPLKTSSASENDLGQKSSFIINFLSAILPYCTYLKRFFFENNHLVLKRIENFTKDLPYILSKRMHTGHEFLNKLIAILSLAGELRKANIMVSFLKSSINLFTNICKLKGYDSLNNIVCLYTKELIFLRPPLNVAFQLTYLLKEASRYPSFVQYLLNRNKNGCSKRKGGVYFSKDACRFYIFALILDRCFSKNKTAPLDVCLNMLFFMYNTYKSSYFLHHQNTKECECLPQLYKLEVEIIFRALEKQSEESTESDKSKWSTFFNNKIVLKILNLMAFHCYDLIEKHVTVYTQFKEIERQLRERGVCDLERLNINEDMPEINSSRFDNIGF